MYVGALFTFTPNAHRTYAIYIYICSTLQVGFASTSNQSREYTHARQCSYVSCSSLAVTVQMRRTCADYMLWLNGDLRGWRYIYIYLAFFDNSVLRGVCQRANHFQAYIYIYLVYIANINQSKEHITIPFAWPVRVHHYTVKVRQQFESCLHVLKMQLFDQQWMCLKRLADWAAHTTRDRMNELKSVPQTFRTVRFQSYIEILSNTTYECGI